MIMLNDDNQNNCPLTWKADPLYGLFINNLIKISILISVFLGIIVLIDDEIQMCHLKGVFPFLAFTAALVVFAERINRKVAYEINIIHEHKKISLKMYRSHKKINLQFDQIEQIRLSGCLIFIVNGKRIFFGGRVDKKLLKELGKIRTIKLGALSKISISAIVL